MTDAELIAAIEDGSLAESEFRHANHVRAAYAYLRAASFPEAIGRMSRALRRSAAARRRAPLSRASIPADLAKFQDCVLRIGRAADRRFLGRRAKPAR